MSVGSEIRRLRKERGLTQAELGAPLFTHAYVSSIESGRRKPSQRVLEHFAHRLRVATKDLAAGRPPGLEAELTLRLHEARLQVSAGGSKEAAGRFEALADEAGTYELTQLQAKAIEGSALCLERSGDLEGAVEVYERAEELAAQLGPGPVADPLVGRARCIHMLGDTRYAIYLLEGHLDRIHDAKIADPDTLVRIHAGLISPYFDTGLYKLAAESARLVMALRSQVADPFKAATMFVNVARVLHFQNKHSEALAMLRRAEQLFHEAEYRSEAGIAHLAHAFVLSNDGQFDEALEQLSAAEQALTPTGNPIDIARVLNEKGRVLRKLGRATDAVESFRRAIPLLEHRHARELAFAHRELALAHLDTDEDAAEKYLRSAIEHYGRAEDEVQLAVTYRYLGDLYAASNRRAAASESYRTGLQALRERL